jgi:Zn-dependent M28 family amino/carboxypeptidase
VAQLLNDRRDLGALLLLDMTGHNPRHERDYQLNPGGLFEAGQVAMQVAALAALLSPQVAPRLSPVVRPPTDMGSYLYNTDGVIYAEAGFPVLFFNEVMNRYRIGRSGYHDTGDTLKNIDVPYAAAIARVAITTAAVLAQIGVPPS